jgi:hypothetical protein
MTFILNGTSCCAGSGTPSAGRGLIVAAITRVYTVRLAAKILGRVEELLWELADQLEPEDGMLWKDLIAACIGMSPSLRSG